MDIYHYHPVTGEYLGASIADESPREPGVFVVPGYATKIAPPAPAEGNKIVFKDGAWGYVHIALPEEPPSEEPVELTPEQKRALMAPLTPRDFRDALIDNDIFPEDVTAAIQEIPDAKARAKALNAWEYPLEFRRDDPLVDQIAASFGMMPEAVDDLWQQATST
jgi:hypothetical protein